MKRSMLRNSLERLVPILNSCRGRDKVIKLVGYLVRLEALRLDEKIQRNGFGGNGQLEQQVAVLNRIISQLSQCRVVLRLFDDLVVVRDLVEYGLGTNERNFAIRTICLVMNSISVLDLITSKISWFASNDFCRANKTSNSSATTTNNGDGTAASAAEAATTTKDNDDPDFQMDRYDDSDEEGNGAGGSNNLDLKSLITFEANTNQTNKRKSKKRKRNEDDDVNEDDEDDDEEEEEVEDTDTKNDSNDDDKSAEDVNDDDSDSGSEIENKLIKPDDNLIVIGRVSDSLSVLEIHVFNEDESSFYVHHDVILPEMPLCMEWLNYDATANQPGNLCAIGTMKPTIEIWDLDLVNCLESAYKLRGSQRVKANAVKKRRRASLARTNDGHSREVLDLSWNRNFEHILASSSADRTVILWDLEECKAHTVLCNFERVVSCLEWNPSDYTSLLAGSHDRTVKLFDQSNLESFKSWNLASKVDKVEWDTKSVTGTNFYATTTNGHIYYADIRNESEFLYSQKLSKSSIGSIILFDFESKSSPSTTNTNENRYLVTNDDQSMKVWSVGGSSSGSGSNDNEPLRFVCEHNPGVGEILTIRQCPDNPFKVAIGGNRKDHNFTLYDLRFLELH